MWQALRRLPSSLGSLFPSAEFSMGREIRGLVDGFAMALIIVVQVRYWDNWWHPGHALLEKDIFNRIC